MIDIYILLIPYMYIIVYIYSLYICYEIQTKNKSICVMYCELLLYNVVYYSFISCTYLHIQSH